MSATGRSPHQTQPITHKLSPKSLLSLPYRLLNPPPALAQVRSYSVTPVFNVQLEDVLNRRHLPPLGLKDFEEWLLYVEKCPENLYFILWLKDYTVRHKQWALQLTPQPAIAADYRPSVPTQTSSHLLMFYARAKQTFFTPNSEYELDVPSDILSPFHTSKFGTTPPDPAIFAPVACEVQRMLNESLKRFVFAAYTNVGTKRGLCGILGGIAIALLGSVPPIVYNIVTGKSRWLRLTALPAMWLGLTILIASLHGVCMMIYIFGDLRQLRKFELHRPPISRPRPLTPAGPCPVTVPTAITRQPLFPPNQPPRRMSMIPPPPRAFIRECDHHARTMSTLTTSSSASSSRVTMSEEIGEIDISPAYFDEEPVDVASATNSAFPVRRGSTHDDNDALFAPTASFIHPYDPSINSCPNPALPERHQPISAFDFDGLPSVSHSHPLSPPADPTPPAVIIQPDSTSHTVQFTPKSLLARAQYQCNLNMWKVNIVGSHKLGTPDSSQSLMTTTPTSPSDSKLYSSHHRWRSEKAEENRHTHYKAVQAVPAFASPMTPVLNPLVIRAQWEIVVRSAALAFKASCIVVGCLLIVPVKRV